VKDIFYKESERVLDKLPKHNMKMLLGYFSAKVAREDIFKLKIWNGCLHGISYENVVRLVNFPISKNLEVKSKIFQHYNIHKFNWMSPYEKSPQSH
jgi:hypothetical protein